VRVTLLAPIKPEFLRLGHERGRRFLDPAECMAVAPWLASRIGSRVI
jgi:hypothetical protein